MATLELENETLRKELIALRRVIDAMQNLSDAANETRTHEQILDLLEDVLNHARLAIAAKDGSLLILDEDTGELVFVIAQGEIPTQDLIWRRIPKGEGIAGWVAEQRRATIVNNAHSDARFWDALDDEFDFVTHTILAAPILGAGRVLGVVELLNKDDGLAFTMEDQALLTLVCRFAGELLFNMTQTQPPTNEPELSDLPAESR